MLLRREMELTAPTSLDARSEAEMARGAGGVGAVGVPDQPQGAAASARMYAAVLSTMPPISLLCFSLGTQVTTREDRRARVCPGRALPSRAVTGTGGVARHARGAGGGGRSG